MKPRNSLARAMGMSFVLGSLLATAMGWAETMQAVKDDAPVKRGEEVILRLKQGQAVEVVKRQGNWIGVKVQTEDGEKTGWVHRNDLAARGGPSAPAGGVAADGESIAVLRYNGASPGVQETSLHALMKDPQIQAFLTDPRQCLEAAAKAVQPKTQVNLWSLVPLLSTDITAVLTELVLPGGFEAPSAKGWLVIRTGKEGSPQHQAVTELLNLAKAAIPPPAFSTERLGEIDVAHVQLGPIPVQYALAQEQLVVAIGPGVLQGLLEKPETRLPALPLPESVLKGADRGTEVFTLFYNHAKLMRLLGPAIPPQKQAELDRIGLNALSGVTLQVRPQGRGYKFLLAVAGDPAQAKGLTGLLGLAGKPLSDDVLRLVPRDVPCFTATSFNLAGLYEAVRALLAAQENEPLAQFDQGVQKAEARLGFKIGDDLLGSFGGEVLVMTMPGGNFLIPSIVGVLEVADGEKLDACLEKLVGVANEELAKTEDHPFGPENPVRLRISEAPAGEATIRVLNFDNVPVPVSLCYARTGRHIALALYPHVLKDYLRFLAAGGPDIRSNPDFQEVWKQLPAKSETLFYSDFKKGVQSLYPLVPAAIAALNGIPQNPVRFDPGKFPSWSVVEPYLFGSAGAARRVDGVWTLEIFSPAVVPLFAYDGGLNSLATTSVLAGLLLPAVARARGEARTVGCMANLKSLYIAAEAYNMDQAKYPSALSELKEKGHAEGAVFRCPTDPSPAKIAEDFECSYECAFDRPGFPAGGMGVEFPAIWDKNPGHHGGVRNVAFFDGHVERVTEARFQELIKKLDEEMGKEPPKEENGEGEEGATEGEGGDEGEGATEEGKEEGKEETEEGDEEGTKEGVKKETEEGAKEE